MRTLIYILFSLLWLAGCGNQLDIEISQKRQAEVKKLAPQGKRTNYEAAYQTVSPSSLGLASAMALTATAGDRSEPLHLFFKPQPNAGISVDELFADATSRVEDLVTSVGLDNSNFKLVAEMSKHLDSFYYVGFERLIDDRPVRDGILWLVYQQDDTHFWQLREMHNRAFLNATVIAQQKTITEADVKAWFELDANTVSSKPIYYFVPNAEKSDTAPGLHPAQQITMNYQNETWSIVASEVTGEILESYPLTFSFRGEASVYKRSYLDGRGNQDLAFANWRSGNTTVAANADGLVQGISETNPVQLVLTGARAQVSGTNNGQPYVLSSQPIIDGQIKLNPQGEDLHAINAFISVTRINSYARQFLNAREVPILNRTTSVRINASGNCNAFYQPQTKAITLYAAGNGCANMAEVNDIAYHEWGHGLDDSTGINVGIQDGAFSEGIGDILSGFYIGAAELAPGFMQGNPNPIRNLANNLRYPTDRGEVHTEGQIIGGAFWDMRQGFVAKYGASRGATIAARLFTKHLLVTDSYVDSYNSVLRLDDNDNDPQTPSPNLCLINAAFAKHGLTPPMNCQDNTNASELYGDETTTVALLDSDSKTKVLTAHPSAVAAAICFGDRKTCKASNSVRNKMNFEGQKEGRNHFSHQMTVAPVEQSKFTILLLDQAGNEIGWRTFAFKAR